MRTLSKHTQFQNIIASNIALSIVNSIKLMAKKTFTEFQNLVKQERGFHSYKEQKEYEIYRERLRAKLPGQF